jgi:alcohol dehydrogenase
VNLCKDGGKIVIAGTKGTTGAENLSIDSIIYKELTILGALGVDYNSYSKAVEILDSNEFPFDQLSRLSIGLNDANNLLSELSEGKQDALHCLINPKI